MNKNLKLALFLVGATVFNVVVMFLFIAVFYLAAVLVTNPIQAEQTRANVFAGILFVGFIASIVLTFLVYGRLMKWLQAKYGLEQKFPQLFRKK